MNALTKTQRLVRMTLPVELLEDHPLNPNKMSAREFDLLCSNLESVGITDPILIAPQDYAAVAALFDQYPNQPEALLDAIKAAAVKFTIMGGHHRKKAAGYLEFAEVPVTLIMDPAFTEEQGEIQLLRHNMIKGHLDPTAFLTLYQKYAKKYSDDLMQDMFGFAEESEFKRLVASTKKSLPKEMQAEFANAAKEIKTVDDLTKVLNHLFTHYGDTLDYGYMIFDFEGKRSIWLRMSKKELQNFETLGAFCREHSRAMDDVMAALVNLCSHDLVPGLQTALLASTTVAEGPPATGVPVKGMVHGVG